MALGVVFGAIVNQVAGSIVEGQLRQRVSAEQLAFERTAGRTRATPIGRPGAFEEPTFLVPATRTDTGQQGYRIVSLDQLSPVPGQIGTLTEMPAIIGRPLVTPAMPMAPIAGATEFTAPQGPPTMIPRVIVAQTPPNAQTPRDGTPGGSFNYNSLLTSIFKWDVEVHNTLGAPGANTVQANLNLDRAGIWAYEIYWQAITAGNQIQVEQNHPVNGISDLVHGIVATGQDFRHQAIIVVDTSPLGVPFRLRALIVGADPGGTYALNMWAKQLANL